MRWILIVLLMCNGIYFLWQSYLVQNEWPVVVDTASPKTEGARALVLLSEASSQQQRVASNTGLAGIIKSGVDWPETAEESAGVCWQIGPFREEISAKQVVNRLAALDISLRLLVIEVPGKPDYWVHIPPQVSRKGAIKLLRELQSKKIDSFLITEGELANGLSLGFFTQEDRAQQVYERRVKQGYDAKIKVVPRRHTELWAVFDTGEYGKFSDALWNKVKEGNHGLERHKNYCDKIASADNFE
ncbi:MAG: SPOR domain-containing protein [Pseudomonadales bacterium]